MEIRCRSVLSELNLNHVSMSPSVSIDNLGELMEADLRITSDYYYSFRREKTPVYSVPAHSYLSKNHELWDDVSLLCPEMPVPKNLTSGIRLFLGNNTSSQDSAVAFLHAGRERRIAPVHFDWDHGWVAHACLTGRKRFFLFPPEASWLLNPVVNTSALEIPRFSESDRREVIDRLGGVEVMLDAGEGILFPSLLWHGVFYEESSLGISVRFHTESGWRPYAVLPRSWRLQRLVWFFFRHGYGESATNFLEEYLRIFFRGEDTWRERYRKTSSLCNQTLLKYDEDQGADTWVGENFSPELALASEELQTYYDIGNGEERSVSEGRDQEVVDYLFEGLDASHVPFKSRLAEYALNVRQGLPPKRGLVKIEHE